MFYLGNVTLRFQAVSHAALNKPSQQEASQKPGAFGGHGTLGGQGARFLPLPAGRWKVTCVRRSAVSSFGSEGWGLDAFYDPFRFKSL